MSPQLAAAAPSSPAPAVGIRKAMPGAAGDFSGTFIRTEPRWTPRWVVTPWGSDCAHIADRHRLGRGCHRGGLESWWIFRRDEIQQRTAVARERSPPGRRPTQEAQCCDKSRSGFNGTRTGTRVGYFTLTKSEWARR